MLTPTKLISLVMNSEDTESLMDILKVFDLPAAKASISALMRTLGFGPEADGIATVLVGAFVLFMIIGFLFGPKTTNATNTTNTTAATNNSTNKSPEEKSKT